MPTWCADISTALLPAPPALIRDQIVPLARALKSCGVDNGGSPVRREQERAGASIRLNHDRLAASDDVVDVIY